MRTAIEEVVEAAVFRQDFEMLTPEERFSLIFETIFQEIQELYPNKKIALVCGIISGNGDDEIDENISILIGWRHTIKDALQEKGMDLPTLTSPFIFTELGYEKVGAFALDRDIREALFQQFYRRFLKSGIVSHIFVTPGFSDSPGTLDEISTVNEEGVEIVYVDPESPIGNLASG